MDYFKDWEDYLVISTESLVSDTEIDFQVFDINLKPLFDEKPLLIGKAELKRLAQRDVDIAFVGFHEKEKYAKYLGKNLREILFSDRTSGDKKAKMLYFYSNSLLKEVMDAPRERSGIERVKDLVEIIVRLFLKEKGFFKDIFRLFKYDYDIPAHSVNVCLLSLALAQRAGISDENELYQLGMGAVLHDIGKCEIDERMLGKWGPLLQDEWTVMKKHPLFGEEILRETGIIPEESYFAVLQHHERFNGKGYPKKLKRCDIHLHGRIVGIADVFDALTMDRAYAFGVKRFLALEMMLREMQDSFDSILLLHFIILVGSQMQEPAL
jgi:HD-GYP domain-containing protein (c-di-GMP phosphodiesterase class II)